MLMTPNFMSRLNLVQPILRRFSPVRPRLKIGCVKTVYNGMIEVIWGNHHYSLQLQHQPAILVSFFDSKLCFDTQVTKVVHSCFSQVRQFRNKIIPFSSTKLLSTLYFLVYSGNSEQNIQRQQLNCWLCFYCFIHYSLIDVIYWCFCFSFFLLW